MIAVHKFAWRTLVNARAVFLFIGFALVATAFGANPLLEETIEETYPLSSEGTVSIRNIEGAIRVYGSSGTYVKIVAIKRAYTRERLDGIKVGIDVKPDTIAIETVVPPKKKWGLGDRSGTVEYLIYIPQTASVTRAELETGELLVEGMRGANTNASLGTGRLYSHNCFSNAKLTVERGGLDISYDWWERRSFTIEAQIVSGGVRAWLPPDASFNLNASSDDGNVASDFTPKEKRQGHASNLEQAVGESDRADFHFHANDGNVKVSEVIW